VIVPDDMREPREGWTMTEKSDMQIEEIKTSVEHAKYVVNPRAVAEAMLARAAEQRAARLDLAQDTERE